VVNGLTLNAQLTVRLSVFSRLQSLINQSSGFCGTASRRCPLSRFVEVRKHPLALMLRRPAGSRRNEPGLRRSASPVYPPHPCAWPMDRSFISEGSRGSPWTSRIVRPPEPGSDAACVSCRTSRQKEVWRSQAGTPFGMRATEVLRAVPTPTRPTISSRARRRAQVRRSTQSCPGARGRRPAWQYTACHPPCR
jgi:hypothetical protein